MKKTKKDEVPADVFNAAAAPAFENAQCMGVWRPLMMSPGMPS